MAERVTYVALSFFVFFFIGHDRENKEAPEGEEQVPNRFDTLRYKDAIDSWFIKNLGLKSRHKLDGFLKVLRHLTVKICGQWW